MGSKTSTINYDGVKKEEKNTLHYKNSLVLQVLVSRVEASTLHISLF